MIVDVAIYGSGQPSVTWRELTLHNLFLLLKRGRH